MLPPGLSYNVQTPVAEKLDRSMSTEENQDGQAVPIRVFVVVAGQTQPLVAATINMPPTDPLGFV